MQLKMETKPDPAEYSFRKRPPPRKSQRPNDVYITEKTNFKAQENKCQSILDSSNEVIIHGLGKAVNRAINLALQIKERGLGTIQICAQTSSVNLTDDLIPETDEGEEKSLYRSNSAIHIRVYRSVEENSGNTESLYLLE